MTLAQEHCAPGATALAPDEALVLSPQLPGWTLKEQFLEREFAFKDFCDAMAFVNRVAEIAEREGHHPDIRISYNKVHLTLTTHKIGWLSRNDFIMAAKINAIA